MNPAEPPVTLPAPHLVRRPPTRNPSDAPDSSAPPPSQPPPSQADDTRGSFDWTMFIVGTAAAAAISGVVTYLVTRAMDRAVGPKPNPADAYQAQLNALREEFLAVVGGKKE